MTQQNKLTVVSKDQMISIEKTAKRMVDSKLCPKGMSWQDLAICGQRGAECGIEPGQAMSEIYVVQGTAQFKSELQLELMYKNIVGFRHIVTQWEEDIVEAIFYSMDLPKDGVKRSMTRARADKAEWSIIPEKTWANGKSTTKKDSKGKTIYKIKDQWAKNPIGMLFNRLISEVARTQFPQYKSSMSINLVNYSESQEAISNLYPETETIIDPASNNVVNIETGEVVESETKRNKAKQSEVVEVEVIEKADPTNEEEAPVEEMAEQKDNSKCPKCGHDMVEKEGKYGTFTACSNYPACKYIQK